MQTTTRFFIPVLALWIGTTTSAAQSPNEDDGASALRAETFDGLKLRSIGPALMGGRIADIAVSPRSSSEWYVAVGSGGVWKTTNAGVTWTPLFDQQSTYSIGCVTVDPTNPDIVWVGTGENVSGRHVGWGDGVYKSLDGGDSWKLVGLESSEHIGKIVVDPRDGNVVYVAAEGPLWSSGGERGLYKTIDGGMSWTASLVIDEDTGVTDLEMDPRNPEVLIAASYQRRRHTWSLLAGGKGSGIHRSTDGGATWRRISRGLPGGDMGKIGLAISPANPDVVYAAIEADDSEKGFYRSTDRGESWEHRNSYTSSGTGPHYYQELEASPHDVDRVYQMDVFLHATSDGGKTFDVLGTGREKHSDNHALWIDPKNPEHLLAGTDASLYESFDHGTTWRQFPNLPLSQFYKLSLDNAEPFYNISGGAQDLGTLIGPSRTDNMEGVRNRDWYVPLGADGYDTAFDPLEDNIVYMQTQGGRLQRYDRQSHEFIDVQPMPAPGDPPERFNWDSPIVVSPHSNTRLYFGSQRLWRSDDRGDSWTAVSSDLTRNESRYQQEVMGRVWSIDALYGNTAMSLYGTVTTISESPVTEGLLYVGTDDGLVQVSEDGGASFRVSPLPDVPELSFINDVQASVHDSNSAFVVVDAHKTGDFRPHVFKTNDRGRSWISIASDLPQKEVVWALEQDHIDEQLLFLGAEFGLYFSSDGGAHWIELTGDVPTIAFRDIELQRRDGDLVGASFGRGFYVLDDYSALRNLDEAQLNNDAVLFPVRDGWWYVPSVPNQAPGKPSMGSDDYTAPNPPYGAIITYYLKETRHTAKENRRTEERRLRDASEDVPNPEWQSLADEALETAPKIIFIIRNEQGEPVRRLEAPTQQGVHRVSWDLRLAPPDPIELETSGFIPPWVTPPQGPFAPPGPYRVEMALVSAAGVTPLGEPQEFLVKPLPRASLAAPNYTEVTAFQARTSELVRTARAAARELAETEQRMRHLRAALGETPRADGSSYDRLAAIDSKLAALRVRLVGDRLRGRLNEASAPSILDRAGRVAEGHWNTRQAPTKTQVTSLEIAEQDFQTLRSELTSLVETDLLELEAELESAGAPWSRGRRSRSR